MTDQQRVQSQLEQLHALMEELRWPYFIWAGDPRTQSDVCTGGGITDIKASVIEGVNLIAKEVGD